MNTQAFPVNDIGTHGSYGMTLRDYFAAKAMQGMLSDSSACDEDTGKKLSIPDDCDSIAFVSYKMADAMMKARES